MKNIDVMYSKKSDDWKTPSEIYKAFMSKGYIDCFKYKSKENELNNSYYDKKLFIKPPFSKMKNITDWIINQTKNNEVVALLIPARTDTKYFHKLLKYDPKIIFIQGRLKYNNSKSAPFPTILLLYIQSIQKWWYYNMTQEQLIKYIKNYL